MSGEIERFVIGHIHTVVYQHETDDEVQYEASFEADPDGCVQGCYSSDLLDDLAQSASAASLVIRCVKGQLSIMETSEQLLRHGVIRPD